jgi:hypothetical protein
MDPVSSDNKPTRNTIIRVFCILWAVFEIFAAMLWGLAAYSDPFYGFISFCTLFAGITLFILGIHKSFAKEGGQYKAIGLLFGNYATLHNVQNELTEWIIFDIVKTLFFVMVYLGVSYQKQVKFFRYFAPLQWNYRPSQ